MDKNDLAVSVLEKFISKKLTLATAESCTGGLLADRITDVPGSSNVLMTGIVAYSNLSKINLLKVNEYNIEKDGAVSESVAKEMASGVRRVAGSDVGVGITGVAGPTGGSDAKPVGLVFVSIDFLGDVTCTQLNMSGSRREIKTQTVDTILTMLLHLL